MDTNEEFFLSTNMTFNEENRRIFTGLIARAIDKVDVSVIFLLKFNYNEMASMVKQIYESYYKFNLLITNLKIKIYMYGDIKA